METTTSTVANEKVVSNVVEVKIVNKSNNQLPEYKTSGSAGMDICAYLPDGEITLNSGERKLIKTGLFIQLPEGYEAQVRSRSGLALKFGVAVLNAPGTVDSDYTGEIGVILYNSGDAPYTISNGDRIAQLVIAKHEQASWNLVEELEQTERASGGFGSTGVK